MKNSVILNNAQIQHKTKRIAYQILESNSSEKEVVLAGIVGKWLCFCKTHSTRTARNFGLENIAMRSTGQQEKSIGKNKYLTPEFGLPKQVVGFGRRCLEFRSDFDLWCQAFFGSSFAAIQNSCLGQSQS